MKNTKKVLLGGVAALALVGTSVFGTYMYLTSQANVTNTFTVGNVNITMDETDIDDSTPIAERDTANTYHICPGQSYTKDPIVHVEAGSEDSWVFVTVKNEIAPIEENDNPSYKSITAQIEERWKKIGEKDDTILYKYSAGKVGHSDSVTDLTVFTGFTIDDEITGKVLAGYNNKTVIVNAYAVQAEGFTTAEEAWNTAFSSVGITAPATSD